MISLNYRDSRPIYEQIKESFRKLIVAGAMQEDEKLPSVRALATQLSINPNTIQRAYNELESEGYIYSVPGKGSFVAPSRDADRMRREELKQAVQEMIRELRYLGADESELTDLLKDEEAAQAERTARTEAQYGRVTADDAAAKEAGSSAAQAAEQAAQTGKEEAND